MYRLDLCPHCGGASYRRCLPTTKGQKKSNIGGWHSPFFDLNDNENEGYKFLKILQPYIIDVFKSYGWAYDPKKVFYSGMWAIINKKGNLNNEHIHPNSNLSAAYYVKAPKGCVRLSNDWILANLSIHSSC